MSNKNRDNANKVVSALFKKSSKRFQRLRDLELETKHHAHYNIRESILWYDNFDNEKIRLTAKNGEQINFKITTSNLPHLLGLQYLAAKNNADPNRPKLTSMTMLGMGIKFCDEAIYSKVKNCGNNPSIVRRRCNGVKPFFENLKNASLIDYNPSENGTSTMNFTKAIVTAAPNGKTLTVLGVREKREAPGEFTFNTFLPTRKLCQFKGGLDLSNTIEKIEVFEKKFNEWREMSFNEDEDMLLKDDFIVKHFENDFEKKIKSLVMTNKLDVVDNNLVITPKLETILKHYDNTHAVVSFDTMSSLAGMVYNDINKNDRYSEHISTYDTLSLLTEGYNVVLPQDLSQDRNIKINTNSDYDL